MNSILRIDGGLSTNFQYDKDSGFYDIEKKFDSFFKKISKPKIKNLKHTPCKICKSEVRLLFKKGGFTFAICKKCSFIFVVNPLAEKKLKEIYKKAPIMNTYFSYMKSPQRSKFEESKYLHLALQIQQVFKRRRLSICDVGCGSGQGLGIFKKNGFSCFGIEPNKAEANNLRRKGFKIINSTFTSKHISRVKNTVFLCLDVLEHIKNPIRFLNQFSISKNKNNYIVLGVPNVGSLATAIKRKECTMFCGYSHLNYFNCSNLVMLAKQANFKIYKIQTYISGINLILDGIFDKTFINMSTKNKYKIAKLLNQLNLGHKIFLFCKIV